MSNVSQPPRHRRRTALGILGAALMTTALTGGVAAAQDASAAPDGGTIVVTPADPAAGPQGGPVFVSGGVMEAGPGTIPGAPGTCGAWHTVTVGPDGITREQRGGDDGSCAPGGPIVMDPFGPGRMFVGGTSGSVESGTLTIEGAPVRLVTVTAVDGATVSLMTDDGWTKNVDTTNVVITLDRATLTAADLAVGDTLQVDQTRNANDTYTITGLEVVLPQVLGVVAPVDADSFTVTQPDGTATIVHVSDATKWSARMPGTGATGLAALTDGDVVVARGKLEADGSMDAASVTSAGMTVRGDMGSPGMGSYPPAPAPTASPEASPTPNG